MITLQHENMTLLPLPSRTSRVLRIIMLPPPPQHLLSVVMSCAERGSSFHFSLNPRCVTILESRTQADINCASSGFDQFMTKTCSPPLSDFYKNCTDAGRGFLTIGTSRISSREHHVSVAGDHAEDRLSLIAATLPQRQGLCRIAEAI